MRRTLAIVLVAGGIIAAAQAADDASRFRAGVEAYEAGRWEDAEKAWGDLAAAGVHDPRIEYNLGNAAWKLGRLGEAVWRWERARRLDPSDADVRGNLDLARSQMKDRLEGGDPAGPAGRLAALQDTVGLDAPFLAACLLLWGAVGLAAWAAAAPGRFTPAKGWTIAGLALAAGLAALWWWSAWLRLGGTPEAIVLRPAVEVVAGPGENNATLATVHEGTTVRVRTVRGAWVQIEIPSGVNGWAPRDVLGPL